MNIKGFRRMLLGEKMPDKNDPKYKERYERDVNAGRKFAKATRIDKAAAKVQGFANMHRTLFLVIIFTFVLGGLAWNIYRLTVMYHHQPSTRTATEVQDSVLRERHRNVVVPRHPETGIEAKHIHGPQQSNANEKNNNAEESRQQMYNEQSDKM